MPRLARRSSVATWSEDGRCQPVTRSVDFFTSSSKAMARDWYRKPPFQPRRQRICSARGSQCAALGAKARLRHGARPNSALQPEKLLRIASGQRRDGRRIETLNGSDKADRVILRHVIGVIGSKQDMVETEHFHQCGELMRREHDRIDIDSLEISRGRPRQCAVTIGTRTPGMVDATEIGAKISAAMHRQDFESRMTLKDAIEDQIVQRDRRLQRIADDIVEIEPCQPGSFSKAVGMDHHQGPELLRFLPEWRECRI